MVFAMRGGGSRGGLECHITILKNNFFENHLESFPDCSKRVLHLVWVAYYVYIVVEVNVNFEPIIRGLKSDIFEV